jgi:hypothetical protein
MSITDTPEAVSKHVSLVATKRSLFDLINCESDDVLNFREVFLENVAETEVAGTGTNHERNNIHPSL